MLTSELPEDSTFINTDRDITPPNTLRLASGFAFVNQTTLPSTNIANFNVPFAVKENVWYRVKTTLNASGIMSVSINGTDIFSKSLGGSLYGSFGFGAWQDQAAYVRNVAVTDTANGTLLCSFNMTDSGVLAEFGAQSNLESVCLDGPKRDRLVWAGDFYHTCRIVGVSTSRFDLTRGTLDFISRTQIQNGDFNTAPVMSYDPAIQGPYLDASGDVGQQDYEVLVILAFTQYVAQTKDVSFVKETWSRWRLHADRIISQISPDDGLVHLSYGFIGPGAGGSAVSCATVEGLKGMADVASIVGDDALSSHYDAVARNLSDAINARLWNDDVGAYALDLSDMGVISTSGTGLCITSGVAGTRNNRTARSLAAVSSLAVHPAYKDNSQSSDSDKLSPFMNGFLLPAFFTGNDSSSGMSLLRSLWGAMQADNNTSSGASWEYINPDGSPGLGYFTSLSHPWGGAATYVLTEYVAGLRRQEGAAGTGHRNWVLAPDAGIRAGLKEVEVQVQTPTGTLSVNWKVLGRKITARISAPKGTSGMFKVGNSSVAVQSGISSHTLPLPSTV